MTLLVEKYRPKTLDEIVGFDKTRISFDECMPHLLLYGPPGTGKTTLAKVIIRTLEADHVILNSSDERGIDTIRERVKTFASTQSNNQSGIKIILLDESDALTPDAQNSLRNIMETYSRNCRFILTANYPNKIIEPLKSRCMGIEFNKIDPDKIVDRLKFICEAEKIPYEMEALRKIVDINGNDIRRSVNKLEELRSGVTLDKIVPEVNIAFDVWSLIQESNFEAARQTYLDSHQDPEQFIKDLHDVIWASNEDIDYKKQAIRDIAEHYKFLSSVAWKDILVEALILRLIDIRI